MRATVVLVALFAVTLSVPVVPSIKVVTINYGRNNDFYAYNSPPKDDVKINKELVRDLLGLSYEDELQQQELVRTNSGTYWARIFQLYKETPISAHSITLEVYPNGEPTGYVVGRVITGLTHINITTEPSITKEQAYMSLKHMYNPGCGSGNKSQPQPTITKKSAVLTISVMDEKVYLTYDTSYFVNPESNVTNASHPHGVVDASNGKLLDHWEGLQEYKTRGIAGNMGTGPHYFQMDVTRSNNKCSYVSSAVEVRDFSLPNGKDKPREFDCVRAGRVGYDFINGGFSPLNEVFKYSQVTHDYWMEALKRPPIGNSRKKLKIIGNVHVGQQLQNGYWDGSAINIGDGGSYFYPFSELNIVSHEIAHGFTHWTSRLVYSGESGGMSESFSDIAAEAVEAYYLSKMGKKNDWLLAPEIYKRPDKIPVRNMKHPTSPSINHYNLYNDGISVHKSSGVYNKAFYTLATKPGWNIHKAFKVVALANWVHWEPKSTMHCGVCGIEAVANDQGLPVSDVISAFATVGLRCSKCS